MTASLFKIAGTKAITVLGDVIPPSAPVELGGGKAVTGCRRMVDPATTDKGFALTYSRLKHFYVDKNRHRPAPPPGHLQRTMAEWAGADQS